MCNGANSNINFGDPYITPPIPSPIYPLESKTGEESRSRVSRNADKEIEEVAIRLMNEQELILNHLKNNLEDQRWVNLLSYNLMDLWDWVGEIAFENSNFGREISEKVNKSIKK